MYYHTKIIIFFIIILIIVFLLSVIYIEYLNNSLTNAIFKLNFIKYENFKEDYKSVNYKVPLYVFFHFCPDSDDKKNHLIVIDSQIKILMDSGLYNDCEKVLYGCNCKNCDTFLDTYLQHYSKFEKLNSAICPNTKSYENGTINAMLDFAKNSDQKFYGLYMHTKGTNSKTHSWRNFMMYWLVTRYQICVNILDKGFNTVGLNYYSYLTGKLLEVLNIRLGPYNINFYSGNFFWFCSDYLKKLDEIIYLENRYSAETFILSKYEKNKHINLLDQRYFSPYTIDMPIKPLKESEIKLAIF